MALVFFVIPLRAQFSPAEIQAAMQELEEERRRITSDVSALQQRQDSLDRRFNQFSEQLQSLRLEHARAVDSVNKLSSANSSQLNREQLKDAIDQLRKERQDDFRAIESQIENLKKIILASSSVPPAPTVRPSEERPRGNANLHEATERSEHPRTEGPKSSDTSTGTQEWNGEYFEHTIEPKQTLSDIIAAYNKNNGLKVTLKDVLKANPRLNKDRLLVGRKIRIPAIRVDSRK